VIATTFITTQHLISTVSPIFSSDKHIVDFRAIFNTSQEFLFKVAAFSDTMQLHSRMGLPRPKQNRTLSLNSAMIRKNSTIAVAQTPSYIEL
jgi:hypothetical protein